MICLCSCSNHNVVETHTSNSLVSSNKLQIIYELPDKTLNFIKDSLLNNCEVAFVEINSNNDNVYYYSFILKTDEINEQEKLLVSETNRFLYYFDSYIPIVFGMDYIYCRELNNSINKTSEFDQIILKVNAKGEVLDGFSYR